MSDISFPKGIEKLESVTLDSISVNESFPQAFATYEMVASMPGGDLVTGRIEQVTLDDLSNWLEASMPEKFHSDAIKLGFGNGLIKETIEKVSPVTNDQIEMFLPLFVVFNNVAQVYNVVSAEYKMEPSTDRRRARLGMMLHYPCSTYADSSVLHLAGTSYADLGFISSHWNVNAVVNASSQWFANFFRRASEGERYGIVDSCTSVYHKTVVYKDDNHWDAKNAIQVAVSGICAKCSVIESSVTADLPF